MKMPTHIVIDTTDGWVWSRDRQGNPLTEKTATAWAALMNSERKFVDEKQDRERTGFIVASVTPVMSPELMAAIIRDRQETAPMIEAHCEYPGCIDPADAHISHGDHAE